MSILKFTVMFTSQVIYRSDYLEIHHLAVNNETIGYICDEFLPVEGAAMSRAVTPFTAAGLLNKDHCISCAAKTLFSEHVKVPVKMVSVMHIH